MSSEKGRYWLGAGIAVALAGAAVWQGLSNQPESEIPVAEGAETAPASPTPEPETVVVETEDVAGEEAQVAEPEVAETDVVDETAEEAIVEAAESEQPIEEEQVDVVDTTIQPPSLDTFRVENDGQTVLAGRAAPGAVLDILVGGEVVERVNVDGSGSFFTFLDIEPSTQSRSLTIIADPDGNPVEMAQTFFVEPFGVEEDQEDTVEVAEAEVVPGAVAPIENDEEVLEIAEEEAPSEDVTGDDQTLIETAEAVSEDPVAKEVAELENEVIATAEEQLSNEVEETTVESEFADTANAAVDGAAESVDVAEVAEEAVETVDQEESLVAVAEPDEAADVDATTSTKDVEVAEADTEALETETLEIAQDAAEPVVEDESVVVTEAIEEIFGDALESGTEEVATLEVPLPENPPEPETIVPESPTVLVADEEGVRVVASGPAPQALSQVALDTITYDPTGEVLIAGRASTDGFVQVYIDNKPITTSRISRDLNWSTDLPEVDTGIYTLRIDEVDEDGTVVSRLETPFKREEPETVAAVMAEETAQDDFEVAVKTVQPGATLWAIAREKYGQGILYVAVYEANQDLIRDPDLIYPGQIFVLPELEEEVVE